MAGISPLPATQRAYPYSRQPSAMRQHRRSPLWPDREIFLMHKKKSPRHNAWRLKCMLLLGTINVSKFLHLQPEFTDRGLIELGDLRLGGMQLLGRLALRDTLQEALDDNLLIV